MTRENLSAPAVVNRIVREFSAWVVRNSGAPDFVDKLEFESRRLNNLFLGITPDQRYELTPWHSPEGLGEDILHLWRINGFTRLAVRDAVTIHAERLILIAFGEGAEPEKFAVLDFEVARLARALLPG